MSSVRRCDGTGAGGSVVRLTITRDRLLHLDGLDRPCKPGRDRKAAAGRDRPRDRRHSLIYPRILAKQLVDRTVSGTAPLLGHDAVEVPDQSNANARGHWWTLGDRPSCWRLF